MSKMFVCYAMTLLSVCALTRAQEVPTMLPFDHSSRYVSNSNFSLSGDNKKIVVSGMAGLLQGGWSLWDLTTGKRCSTGKLELGSTHSVAISPDGKWIAAGGDGAELKLFDAATGKLTHNLEGHRACFGIGHVQFTPDSKYLISLADDNIIRVWSMTDNKPFAKYCFTAKKEHDNRWRTYPDKPHEKAKIAVIHDRIIEKAYAFALAPTGKTLGVTTGTKEVFLLELLTGKLLKRMVCKEIDSSVSLAFSADGSLLAIGGALEKGFIEVWDIDRNTQVALLDKHDDSVLALAISSDNKTVISGGSTDGARLWDVKTKKLKYRFHPPKNNDDYIDIRTVGFLADGKTCLTLPGKEPVRFWDTATGGSVDPIQTSKRKP